ncbi:hypothetical protein BC829DRAFT_385047 [Chytridium lagenaria]|nr:hypothetical protein BC829DRAFT_385047 [Chytridium lagenaria]
MNHYPPGGQPFPGSKTQYGAPPTFNPPPQLPTGGQFSTIAPPVIHSAPIVSMHSSSVQPSTYFPSPMDKLTTVFVGSITEGVYDNWMERVLRTCGVVRTWKRVTDSNARPKGFGFCIYDSAESVLRALRILGGEGTDTGVDAVARRHIEEYKAAVARTNSDDVVARGDAMAREELNQVLNEMKSVSAESFLSSIMPAAPSGNPLDDLPEEMPAEERERERSAAKDREKREREERLEERRRQEERDRDRNKDRDVDRDRRMHDERRVDRREEVDEEEEKRRQERRERENAQAFAERENRYLMRESQRLRALHGYQNKQADAEAKRIRDKEGMMKRLEEWDDDIEKARGQEDYYVDRPRWVSRRQLYLQREMEMDNKDRAAEQEELARLVPDVDRAEAERSRREQERTATISRERDEERHQHEKDMQSAAAGSGFVVGRIENLVKSIPTEKDALVSFPVKWQHIDKNLIDTKLRPFIAKKVAEVLGEEDRDMIDFISQAIKKQMNAMKLIDELAQALDEEAEILVVKLWRMVIYESEARAMGIA